MKTYTVKAYGTLEARDDADCQSKLDGIARVLADGDGDLGRDWSLDAEEAS